MTKTPPCKTCQERSVGCHSSCGPYKSWRAEYDARKETVKKKRLGDDLFIYHVDKKIQRFKTMIRKGEGK